MGKASHTAPGFDSLTSGRRIGPQARTPESVISAAIPYMLVCLLALGPACSGESGDGNGSGGQAGSGTGGASATGGAVSTGGRPTGGTSGSGGKSGSGGATATGGVGSGGMGSGGMGTGGVSKGGALGSGGSTGSGGTVATGGMLGTGGGSGGTTGAGGQSSGGVTGSDAGRADAGPDATPDSGGDAGTAFAPCPTTAGTACVILPLGDSITEGCCTSPMGGYRIELFRLANKDKKNITFVGSQSNGPSTVDGVTFPKKHEGRGGYTIDTDSGHSGISGQITQNALTNYKPHIVLLMIGTNDINGNVDTANAPTRLGKLLDDITSRAPSALLVVASIIPSKNDGTNSNFQKYNAAIPGLVDSRAKAGKHVVFLDNYKAFSSNTNYKTAWLADNLHPNDAGYVALGQSWYSVIGSLLPPAP